MCKAFDSIKPTILFKKLEYYGLSRNTLLWFKDYFSNRNQTVRIKNCYSESLLVHYGSLRDLY